MVEKLGQNKLHENGTCSVPKEVQDKLDLEKGEDIIAYVYCEEKDVIELRSTEVNLE